jgi:hypothetical protein
MKTKESQGETNRQIIDVGHRLDELRKVRAELASLRNELFEACCSFQHDPTSVEPTRLSVLAYHLRTLEERGSTLESMIATLQAVRQAE